MAVGLIEENGVSVVEGTPGHALMRRPQDATLVLEACFSANVRAALLYPENLTARFFDLSSGEAGEILDKLRRFQVRLAIVCTPGPSVSAAVFGRSSRTTCECSTRAKPPAPGWPECLRGYNPRTRSHMISRREFTTAALGAVTTLAAAETAAASSQQAPAAASGPAPLKTEFLMDIILDVAAPQNLGTRLILPVTAARSKGRS